MDKIFAFEDKNGDKVFIGDTCLVVIDDEVLDEGEVNFVDNELVIGEGAFTVSSYSDYIEIKKK